MSILDGGLIYPKFVFQQAIDDVFTALTLRLRNPENSNVKTWTNTDPVLWRIYAALGEFELKPGNRHVRLYILTYA